MSLQFTMFDMSKTFESMFQQTFDVMFECNLQQPYKTICPLDVHHTIDNHLNPFWINLIIYKHAVPYWIDSFMVLILMLVIFYTLHEHFTFVLLSYVCTCNVMHPQAP
jgi:hypothetical protein